MRNNRRRVDGLSASVRLFLALALFMSSSPGAGAEPTGSSVLRAASVEDLAEALDELGEAIRAKVDDDLNATASALWYVYDIEQALNGNLAAWAYAAWTGLRAWVSTVNQLKNLGEIWQQLPRIAASGNWISLASYITSMGSLFEAGDGLAFALNGPSYAEGVKNMYDDAGRAGGAQAFQDSIKNSLHTIVWIRPPKPQHDRAILYGGLTLNNLLFQRIQNIKSQTSIENSVSVKEIERAIYYVNLLKDILIRSGIGGLEVEVDRIGGDGASNLTIGAVAQLRNMHTSILDTYSKYLLWRQAKVLVDTVRTGVMGITIILPSGSAAVQSTVLNVDSLAWFGGKRWLAHRYNYQSSLRAVVAEIPQQMVFALSNEFSNTWLLVDVTLSAIERSLSTTGPDPVGSAHDCDRLALHPLDREAGLPGVATENIDIPGARAACERAVREHPKVGRYAFNYARVALAAGDTGSASRLMQQAASSNYILAQNYLGYAFLGQDAPFAQVEGLLNLRQNNEGAARMFMKAALQGDLYGQAMLGWLFATGRGLRKSEAMARMWWGRAAANRDDRYENVRLYAEERLAELDAQGRRSR